MECIRQRCRPHVQLRRGRGGARHEVRVRRQRGRRHRKLQLHGQRRFGRTDHNGPVQRGRVPERDVLHERAGLGDAQRQRRHGLGHPKDSLHDGRHGSDTGQRLGLQRCDQHQLDCDGEVPRLRQPRQRGSRRLPGHPARRHAAKPFADAHRESHERSPARLRHDALLPPGHRRRDVPCHRDGHRPPDGRDVRGLPVDHERDRWQLTVELAVQGGLHVERVDHRRRSAQRCGDQRRRCDDERPIHADAGFGSSDRPVDHAHRRERPVLRHRLGWLHARRRQRRFRVGSRHLEPHGHARIGDAQRRLVRHVQRRRRHVFEPGHGCLERALLPLHVHDHRQRREHLFVGHRDGEGRHAGAERVAQRADRADGRGRPVLRRCDEDAVLPACRLRQLPARCHCLRQ